MSDSDNLDDDLFSGGFIPAGRGILPRKGWLGFDVDPGLLPTSIQHKPKTECKCKPHQGVHEGWCPAAGWLSE